MADFSTNQEIITPLSVLNFYVYFVSQTPAAPRICRVDWPLMLL
jgi:hypothetical protein